MARGEAEVPIAADDAGARRMIVARKTLRLISKALPADGSLEVVLAADAARPRNAAARIVVADAAALGRLLWPPSTGAFGEAYLRGDIDIEGDIWAAIDAGRTVDLRRLGLQALRLVAWGRELRRGAGPAPALRRVASLHGPRHSRARDLAAIRFHYDVGNDFYALWLDRRLVYSCAYFETAETSLDDAQEAKLDLICRKLALRPGQRLLDIGCGWGSLVLFAAERYDVQAVGVTLSAAQAAFAAAEIERRGLAGRVRVEIRDYRDLGPLGSFDAVASIGMFEHVGRERLNEYFSAAVGALKPGGLFLNHGIATNRPRSGAGLLRRRLGDRGFVGRYVFPDGDLVTVEHAIGAARAAGFEPLDVQSLRAHYALTLKNWVERLQFAAEEARRVVDEEVYRTWRVYMAGARRAFEEGSVDVAQVLLARPGADGRPESLPLRPWWWTTRDAARTDR